MSFTQEVKQEIIGLETLETEKISELSAIIHNSIITENCIRIISENNSVIRYIFSLVKDIYQVTPKVIVRRGYNYKKNYIYILEIYNKFDDILSDLGIEKNNRILPIPEDYIIDDDSLLRKYLTGVFLITGSINDPKKSRYHLEFLVNNKEYSEFLKNLLNKFNLNSKTIKRETKYMVYIKEAEKIGDFLRLINATKSLLYYEDIRIYRDHKNMTNRLNNCEQANIDKIFLTASKQVKDIEKLYELDMVDTLDDKLKEVIEYRMKYKESSLSELASIISSETGVEITKSGLNHRFRKIKEILENYLKEKEKSK